MSETIQNHQHRLRIQIPQRLHQVPVLSQLVADYSLTVNIKAAILDQKATGGGWFDLVLEGAPEKIANALAYLNELGVEIWNSNTIAES